MNAEATITHPASSPAEGLTIEPKPRDPSAEPTEADAALAAQVEALVVSSPRPISAMRLAQALGLLPPDEPSDAVPAAGPTNGPSTGEFPAAPPRRRRAKAGPDVPGVLTQVAAAVGALNADYDRTGRAFRIESVAGGFRVMTLPAFGSLIASLQGEAARTRLSHEALVTLAIIAYRQPVKRADLEAIRGVACGEVLKNLLDRKLVTIAGRAEELGRPMLYATTREFLRAFGLASIKDLPTPHELGMKG